MTFEEFDLKIRTLDVDIKKIGDQKTNLIQEMYPYIGKCIEVVREDTSWYIKCKDIFFDNLLYYNFKGDIIKVQGDGFSFEINSALVIPHRTLKQYTFREVSEEEFNKCINTHILDIIKEYMEEQNN